MDLSPPKRKNEENLPFRPAPSVAVSTPSMKKPVPAGIKKLSYKKTKAKGGNITSNENEPPKSTLPNISAATTTNTSIQDIKENKAERSKITLYEKKRRQEFKVVKHNKPHFTDEQAWMVVNLVDGFKSLQTENEADKNVLASDTDSDWDEDKIRRQEGCDGRAN